MSQLRRSADSETIKSGYNTTTMARNNQQIARTLQSMLRSGQGRMRTSTMLVMLVLVGGYLFAEPALESQFGVDLPGIHTPGDQVADAQPAESPQPAGNSKQPAKSTPANAKPADVEPAETPASLALDDVLEEIGRDTYRTKAGLIYGRGSVHGTRIEHLKSHAKDDPDRPGQHGVFDENDPAKLVQLIDEVYLKALEGGRQVQHEGEGSRDVYTVDMQRRIGSIGGESGARRNHPPARHVRLVVDGERFITAYPVTP